MFYFGQSLLFAGDIKKENQNDKQGIISAPNFKTACLFLNQFMTIMENRQISTKRNCCNCLPQSILCAKSNSILFVVVIDRETEMSFYFLSISYKRGNILNVELPSTTELISYRNKYHPNANSTICQRSGKLVEIDNQFRLIKEQKKAPKVSEQIVFHE